MILDVMYYIVVTPLLTVTLTKIAYSGEQEMVVVDALKRMDSILNIQPLSEPAQYEMPKDNSVELRNVSYRYKGSSDYAVRELNISIGSGEHIALVGPSGGGKTTVSRLAARFWDVTGGKITLGGMNVSTADPETLFSELKIEDVLKEYDLWFYCWIYLPETHYNNAQNIIETNFEPLIYNDDIVNFWIYTYTDFEYQKCKEYVC